MNYRTFFTRLFVTLFPFFLSMEEQISIKFYTSMHLIYVYSYDLVIPMIEVELKLRNVQTQG